MESSVDWFYDQERTAEEMMKMEEYAELFERPCVLHDDGAGKVYRFEPLESLCERYGAEYGNDSAGAFERLKGAMAKPDRIEEIDMKATEAKLLAEEASKGSNPQTAAFAAMLMPTLTPTVSDSRVAEIFTLLPEWTVGKEYVKGECFSYSGKTFRASQATIAQEIYPPGSEGTLSLYYEIVIAPDGIIVWAQPRGDFDAPDKGDLRHFPDADGPVYRSLVDGNAYSPEAYPQNWEEA